MIAKRLKPMSAVASLFRPLVHIIVVHFLRILIYLNYEIYQIISARFYFCPNVFTCVNAMYGKFICIELN